MKTRKNRLVVPVSEDDYVLGNPHAKLTLVEYGDYACPYSRHAFGTVAALQRRMGRQLRYVYRQFPVVDRDALSQEAAEAALAAGAQGRFWEAHEKLFSGDLDTLLADPAVLGAALKLDVPRFTTDLREGTYRTRVRDEAEGGMKSGIHGTPTFFINGTRFAGSWELQSLVHALRSRLRALPSERSLQGAATL